jgi:hypothetical protein
MLDCAAAQLEASLSLLRSAWEQMHVPCRLFAEGLTGPTPLCVDDYFPTRLTLELVAQADPIPHLEHFPPKPVLLVHGIYDEVVPIVGHRHLFDALAPCYRERPMDCLFVTHSGEHPTPKALEDFGWTWLIEQIR